MICGSGGSKSRLAKAAAAEPSGRIRDEKLHAFVARSTFRTQKAKNTSRSEHYFEVKMHTRLEMWCFKACFVHFPSGNLQFAMFHVDLDGPLKFDVWLF